MTKPKPRLRVVRPAFAIATEVVKATAKDAVILVPIEEYIELCKAAAK